MRSSPSNLSSVVRSRYLRQGVVAALVLVGALAVAFGEANPCDPPIPSTVVDMQAWINQQIQGSAAAVNTGVGQVSSTSVIQNQTGGDNQSATANTAASQSMSGSVVAGAGMACPEAQAGPKCQYTATWPAPAVDPFMLVLGKRVLIRQEEQVALIGTVLGRCDGYLLVKSEMTKKTLMVNIAKILYVEAD